MAEQPVPVSPMDILMKDLYVLVSIGLSTPLNLPVFRAGVAAQLARHPYLRRIQVTDNAGTPRWVPTATVNVEDHIVVASLDAETTAAGDPDKAVEDYFSSLSTLPMDHTRPAWELHLIDVETSEAASTVALRVHHALADGVALMTLLISSSSSAADPARPAVALPARRTSGGAIYTPPRQAPLLAWIWSYLELAWHTLVDVAAFVAIICKPGEPHTLFMRTNHGGSRTRFVHGL